MSGDKEDNDDKSRTGIVGEVRELVDLLRDYAKQETLGPLKGVGRFIAYGVAGSVALSLGVVLLLLSGLRALQTETGTALTGNLAWIPYFGVMIAAAVIIGLSVRAVTSTSEGDS